MIAFNSLELALAYLERHFWTRFIFPIKAGAKFPPLVQDNLATNASNDPEQIAAWAKKFPNCNWGVAHRKSKILVADVDTNQAKGKQGQVTFDALELAYGWPDTEITTTPSGGHHHIYIGEHIMALGENGIGKDIDSPNYTLIPGCVFADGTSYVGNDADAVPCPEWIYDTIKNAKARSRISNAEEVVVDYDKPENIEAAIDFLKNDAEPAIEGSGGDFKTLKTAMYLKDLGISNVLAVDLLNEYYNPRCEPPWDREGLEKKVENAYNYSTLSKVGGKTAEADFADDPVEPPPPVTGKAKKDREKAQQEAKTRALKREAEKAKPVDEKERIWTRDEVINEWVWVAGIERFILKANTKTMWKRTAFDSKYGYLPDKKKEGTKSMTEALLQKKKGTIARFDEVAFLPGRPQSVNQGTVFNTYTAPDIVPAEGDISWWDDHLAYLFPSEEDRDLVLNWLAWLVQNIRLKPKHALLIQGHMQGTGKSFIAEMLVRILHKGNVSNISQNDLHGDFNGWALRSKLLVIEELRALDRNEVAAKLHPLITQEAVSINEKNLPQREVENCFGVFAMTNHDAAISLDASDRRYLVVNTDAVPRFGKGTPASITYYQTLYDRLKDDAQVAAVAYMLMNRDVGLYDGRSAAPQTAAKEAMIEAGSSDLEVYMIEHKDEFPLSGRIISTEDVINILPKRLEGRGSRLSATIKSILKQRFKAVELGQCTLPNRSRPRLFAINGSAAILMPQDRATVGALYEAAKAKAGKGQDIDAADEFGVDAGTD